MKRSQLNEPALADARRFLSSHTETLRGLTLSATERAQKYVVAVNGIATLATVGFIVVHPSVVFPVWLALGLFLLGLVCCGVLAAIAFHRSSADLLGWIRDVDGFNADRIELETVSANLNARIARWRWVGSVVAYVAFATFIGGSVTGVIALFASSGPSATAPIHAASPPPPRSAAAQPQATANPAATMVAEDEVDRRDKRELDRKLVGFNGDLAHYTLALAILGGLQFLALGGQVLFLRLAFKEAQRAGNIARDAMIAGERAFIFAMGVRGLFERDAATNTYNWRFRPVWKNSGDTPTRNMMMHTECILRTAPLPNGFDFDYATASIAPALIPPNSDTLGGIAPLYPAPAITPQDIVDVQQGKKFIYIWGWAKYSDVFPDTPRHITRFCWIITPLGDPNAFDPKADQNSVNFPTIHHAEGNCADDECGIFRQDA